MKAQITYKEFIEAKSFGFTNPLNTFEVSCAFWISENYIEDKSPVPMFAAGVRPRSGQWVQVDNAEFDFSLLLDLDVRVFAKYKKYVLLKGGSDNDLCSPECEPELELDFTPEFEPEPEPGPGPGPENKPESLEDMFSKMFDEDMKPVSLPKGYPTGATLYNAFDGLLMSAGDVTKRWSPVSKSWECVEIPRSRMTFSSDIYLDSNGRMYIKNRDKYQDYNMETNGFEQRLHAPQFYETLDLADPRAQGF